MTTSPDSFIADTIAALERMPAFDRAACATAIIAAVQGEGDRRIARIRWAAIAELHDEGLGIEEIATRLGASPGAIDLAVQSHRHIRSTGVRF